MPDDKINLNDAIRELRGGHRIFVKTVIYGLQEAYEKYRDTHRFSQVIATLETFWSKYMSLATQVIAALQAQNQAQAQQITDLQTQVAANSSAATQLAALQSSGAIESPADLTTIQTEATALGISFNGSTGTTNGSTGTASPPATKVLTDAAGRTVYQYIGPGGLDTANFVPAGTYTPTNTPIFYYSGDTAPGQQNGLGNINYSLVMVSA